MAKDRWAIGQQETTRVRVVVEAENDRRNWLELGARRVDWRIGCCADERVNEGRKDRATLSASGCQRV